MRSAEPLRRQITSNHHHGFCGLVGSERIFGHTSVDFVAPVFVLVSEWLPHTHERHTMKTQGAVLRSVDRACVHLAETQDIDGAWRAQPDPRILENGLLVLLARAIPELREVSSGAETFVRNAAPQQHHPIPKIIDTWLQAMVRGERATLDVSDPNFSTPTFLHRKLFFNVLATYFDVPCIDGFQRDYLLGHIEQVLKTRKSKQQKAWSAAELGALFLLLDTPTSGHHSPQHEESLAAIVDAQSLNGSIAENPLSTILATAALFRWSPEHEATHRAISYLVSSRCADGTWRFGMAEVWDSALLMRMFAGCDALDARVKQAGLGFLHTVHNSDGGWPYRLGVESDTDTTGMAMLALRLHKSHDGLAEGLSYLKNMRTDSGLWRTWHHRDDVPAEDAIAHAVLAMDGLGQSSDETARAKEWLAQQFDATEGWRAHWYNSRPYASHEIGLALGLEHRATKSAVSQILDGQNADGGWSPTPLQKASTPSASGMALALLAKTVSLDHPQIVRGQQYLIDTQAADGSWGGATDMYAPRPFAIDYHFQTHALAAFGMVASQRALARAA
jgi:squalene-hopene/tetraprenyl-beta-curcumene cyclase